MLGTMFKTIQTARAPKESDLINFYIAIEPAYRSINWFALSQNLLHEEGEECCRYQVSVYRRYGQKLGLSPPVYFATILDFAGSDKKLNLLTVKYIKNLCCNVITLIGFGKGTLSNHTFRHRAMTLLMDSEHKRFHFFDPDTIVQMLTFDWFKYNYICHEQPWVCDLYPVNLK
ncbi:uncharacterized protein LOC142348796 [Convolutriloba macropyga]|uniref:uncharacterized protein LOC142348796 n=1 Tax=Convolutriloba macropyga TaxID=536237 RepID=UPI003F528651